jgi:hypothetical protein
MAASVCRGADAAKPGSRDTERGTSMTMMICKDNFFGHIDGRAVLIDTNTVVSDDSDLYRQFPDRFVVAPLELQRAEVEQATAAPGERRGPQQRSETDEVEQATAAPGERRGPQQRSMR